MRECRTGSGNLTAFVASLRMLRRHDLACAKKKRMSINLLLNHPNPSIL